MRLPKRGEPSPAPHLPTTLFHLRKLLSVCFLKGAGSTPSFHHLLIPNMLETDLIIIGAGPGGYETAIHAAKAGLKTVVIEKGRVGGTCLNVGCIPTKCLCKNAEVIETLHSAERMGIVGLRYDGVDMQKVQERKNEVVSTLVSGIAGLFKASGVISVKGTAQFKDAHTVVVTDAKDNDGNDTETEYTAPNIIIATGSTTKFLPIEGKDLPKVLTSTEILDLDYVPKRLTIIGGGVIGMEFASIFHAFGSEVTVLEFCKEILPNFDSDIAKRLKQSLRQKGINIINNAAVNQITDENDHYSVGYLLKDQQQSVDADIVLMAVGRTANLASLNLADIGIQTDRRGIITDDDLRTNIPGIWAVGDVNGKCQLAHAASFQGERVLQLLLGKPATINLQIVPAAVFTNPEAAMVGLTAEQCKAQGISAKAHKAFFRANGKALAMDETDGLVKILTDTEGRILGCHILGPHAADLIQEVATLMDAAQSKGAAATLQDICNAIHAHPTLGEVVLNAAQA